MPLDTTRRLALVPWFSGLTVLALGGELPHFSRIRPQRRLHTPMEAVMIRLVSRGCFTHNFAKGLVSAPEDREPAVRKLIEGAGGKLVNCYFTTGDCCKDV